MKRITIAVCRAQCLLLLLPAMLCFLGARAQSGDRLVKGQAVNRDGQGIANVNITIKGTPQGFTTAEDGGFSLNVPPNAILVFSVVGYKTFELPITTSSFYTVSMEVDAKGMDEVVVVAYGQQKKSNLTGAVASVKGDKLQKVVSNNPVNALQGRVAGVTVTNSGGSPGAFPDVRIRGVGTFGAHQPLYVIDGTIGDPYYLNTADVESIEVLKDGAAASIYGSTSANGVILITTKKGKKGTAQISFNGSFSSVSPTSTYDLLDAPGYQKVHRMMYENAGVALPAYVTAPATANTDWQDLIRQKGQAQNYGLNLSGASNNFTYALSGNLTKEKGTFIGSDFNKKSLRSRTEYKKGILTVETILNYAETQNEGYKFALNDAYFQSPLLPVYSTSEPYGYALTVNGLPKFENPLAVDHYNEADTRVQYLAANAKMTLQLWKGLTYSANLSYITSNATGYAHHPPYRGSANDPTVSYPLVSNTRSNYRERLMEHLINYSWSKGPHNLALVAGYTAQEKTNQGIAVSVEGKTIVRTVVAGQIVETEVPAGFQDPNFNTISAGTGGTLNASGTRDKYVRLSTLARVNYAYDDRYLFQASVRRDGSSVFGANRRYGVFPAVSAGWNIYREKFFEDISSVSLLKLRASYGELGNEGALGFYDHQALITTLNTWAGGYVQGAGASPWPGSASFVLQNRDLRWEVSKSTNIGIDFGLWNNKISGSLDLYNNRTEGLLITKEVAPSSGVNDPILNVGQVTNKGFELNLTWSANIEKLKLDLTGTFGMVKNTVNKLANAEQTLYGTGLKFGSDHIPTQTMVGQTIGSFYLYTAQGIFNSDAEAAAWKNKDGDALQPEAKAGDIKFLDANGDGVIDEKDKTYQGSGIPKYEFGFNVAASYKGFDLSLFLQGAGGNKIYNGNKFELEGMDAGRNFLSSALNAWTPQNTNTSIPRAVLGDPNRNARESTRFLEDGAYLRLKVVQLGYTLPQSLTRRAQVNHARLYIGGQNLLTITQYTGLDPEVGRTNVLNAGVDRLLYPQNKQWIAGLQITL